jgi:tetratricopeptide (TPR) repeat protein
VEDLAACNAEQEHPRRFEYRAAGAGSEQVLAVHRLAVESGVPAWHAYWVLAGFHLERGELEQASQDYHRYPPFSDSRAPRDRPDDAERARWAALELYRRGDAEGASPFFEAAVRLAPDAPAGLESRFRLALLRGDWGAATDAAEHRLRSCTGVEAVGDLAMMLHVRGDPERAWALFEETVRHTEDPSLWTAAFVGHRVEGRSDEEIVSWLTDSRRQRSDAHMRRYAVVGLLHDRDASDAWPELVRSVHAGFMMRWPDMRDPRLGPEQIRDSVRDSSEFDVLLVKAYADRKRGRHIDSWKNYLRALKPHESVSVGPFWFQPYLAWSAIESGQQGPLERHVERMTAQWKRMPSENPAVDPRHAHFTMELVSAVRSGLEGDPERSRAHLRSALHVRAHTDGSAMLSWFRVVEICEALYRATGDEGYRALALDLARRHARIQPMFAWSWAVVARHASSGAERQRALRTALYLDRRSALLEGAPERDVAAAQRWLERNSPFDVDREGGSERWRVSETRAR